MALGGQIYGAGDGIRTRDIDLGKVALYQLSYSRPIGKPHFHPKHRHVKRYGKVIENKAIYKLAAMSISVC